MKKILLTIVSSICIGLSAHAQSFVEDSVSFVGTTGGCLQKNNSVQDAEGVITNNTANPVVIKWSLGTRNMITGWELESICDPNSCKTLAQVSTGTQFNFTVQPGQTATLLVGIKGGATAGDGTSWVTVNSNIGDLVCKFSTCPLSIKDVDTYNAVDIFPNPANNYINLSLNDKNITAVHVTNVVGRKIAKFDVDANNSPFRIAIDNITNGIYFLQFTDNKGKILAVRKVTKQ